jgi:hypothetical protein
MSRIISGRWNILIFQNYVRGFRRQFGIKPSFIPVTAEVERQFRSTFQLSKDQTCAFYHGTDVYPLRVIRKHRNKHEKP